MQDFQEEVFVRKVGGLDAGLEAIKPVVNEGLILFEQRGNCRTGKSGSRVGVDMEVFFLPFRECFPETDHDVVVSGIQGLLNLRLDGAVAPEPVDDGADFLHDAALKPVGTFIDIKLSTEPLKDFRSGRRIVFQGREAGFEILGDGHGFFGFGTHLLQFFLDSHPAGFEIPDKAGRDSQEEQGERDQSDAFVPNP